MLFDLCMFTHALRLLAPYSSISPAITLTNNVKPTEGHVNSTERRLEVRRAEQGNTGERREASQWHDPRESKKGKIRKEELLIQMGYGDNIEFVSEPPPQV